ncbi:E3 ubiquitin-protein ligase RNF220-like [Ornithodoros turicata]|uniref:E3 ubiquitin-protein ligase RNF220-like n=1 Tax=Ornithodoros turicata TaxID=34597 RepID=UPI003139A3EA
MNAKETVTVSGSTSKMLDVESDNKHAEDTESGLGHGAGPRILRRQLPRKNPVECPLCGLSLRPSELQQHYELELERLAKITKSRERRSTASPRNNSRDSLRRIRANRSARRRRLRDSVNGREGEESTQCPVCQDTIVGSPEILADHVDACLRNSEESGDNGTFEEYEWAGQTRIRATSMLEGGFQAAGLITRTQEDEDVDVELDVDGDDSETYGGPQYSEADVVPLPPEPPDQSRQQMLSAPEADDSSVTEPTGESSGDVSQRIAAEAPLVQDALRDRMRQLENPHVRCLVCLEPYREPAVSVCCWHVYCKDCWLHTLGAKKLCPQCNSITSPADLRRIYL